MFVASLDAIVWNGPDDLEYHRFLRPVINLGTGHRNVIRKCFALLWMLCLIVGPDIAKLRAVLSRIRSLTTDLGGEFKMINLSEMVLPFLRSIGARPPALEVRGP